jgi:hypothetical protein
MSDYEYATPAKAKNPALDLDNPPPNLRSGKYPARVLGKIKKDSPYSYVVAIEGEEGHEIISRATKEGSLMVSRPDLTAGPITKEGWVNIYSDPSNNRVAQTGVMVYQDEAEARDIASVGRSMATVKITWEE